MQVWRTPMRKFMIVAAACVIVSGASIATVAAATPKLTVGVKTLSPTSHVVRIVNRDQVAYREFLVESIKAPRITATTVANKPCPVLKNGAFDGVAFIYQWKATCKRTLAPGQTLNIRLTTSPGKGRFLVSVVVKGVKLRIN
jgi:hypothetical protein